MSDILIESPAKGVGLIRLNRPEARNALRIQLMQELGEALEKMDADAEIRAIIITGDDKAFAAGADIKEMASATPVSMYTSQMIEKWQKIRSIRKPIIAAVSGWCLGGGCELAMACDMIVASETAQFGQPEVTIGVIPGAGGTQRLTHAVGKAIAMEMILNNRFLKAQEALQHGLVNKVLPVDAYLKEAIQMATDIATRAPIAVQIAKEAIQKAYETSLTEAMAYERHLFYCLFSTEDQKEGMSAFVEKRKPNWKGK